MKPAAFIWPTRSRYSAHDPIAGISPPVGNPSSTSIRWAWWPVIRPCQNGLFADIASRTGRYRWIRWPTTIALSPESTPDVDVQPERHGAYHGLLQPVGQPVVTLIGRDLLVPPQRERVGRRPEQPDAVPVGRSLDGPDLRAQVGLHLVHRPTDARVDLDVALHELGLDRVVQLGRQFRQASSAMALRKAIDPASTSWSSISTPSVGQPLLRNLGSDMILVYSRFLGDLREETTGRPNSDSQGSNGVLGFRGLARQRNHPIGTGCS